MEDQRAKQKAKRLAKELLKHDYIFNLPELDAACEYGDADSHEGILESILLPILEEMEI